ncbi:unnamed protein product [Aphanomyces euteiches]|uniref:Uncharacterized protein n=1 Tax=Aphanomyces euteiches TaxID=100861 RepID=A0A6G0XXZ3_9STRA|nr:hypothetical protein Ae201684_000472 [Aphanomyces euteiches]KAH9091735.1 hypothetical protein Ae201684P_011279 [Aphanomyces euteiches]KAH9092157.1 hypothetical protein LEN26_018716 [Aphanomyces euteiches]KAH9107329.1 hypothetical protein AeMF1_017270 [Aphanomyces euteiches]KAH9146011.1 hypothetical protein AeRB84_010123 [Aphanomyces euteiches]
MSPGDTLSATWSPSHLDRSFEQRRVPDPETYMPHATKLGLLALDPSTVLRAESFKDVRTRTRHLALLCGFQIRMAKGSSNRRRVWVCSSVHDCPFAVVAQQTKDGIHIKTKLQHNHVFLLSHEDAKRFTTATTEELACYVRQSELYRSATDVSKLSAKQISDVIYAHTGRHVRSNRASVIKKLLLERPETLIPSATLFQDQLGGPPSSPSSSLRLQAPPPPAAFKSLADAVWDCFVCVASSIEVAEMLGDARLKHMIHVFRHDRDTLRASLLMSCPRPDALPCMVSNPPNVDQFVHNYIRQSDLGFF